MNSICLSEAADSRSGFVARTLSGSFFVFISVLLPPPSALTLPSSSSCSSRSLSLFRASLLFFQAQPIFLQIRLQ